MPEKVDLNTSRNAAIVRTPVLRVEVIRWDWDRGRRRDNDPFDLTPFVVNFRWQKSIKTPRAGGQLTTVAQIGNTHILDYLNPMDVIRIYEFGVLKYQGYIRRIGATGIIGNDGKPWRTATITTHGFGSLLMEGALSLNMFLKIGESEELGAQMEAFSATIADIINAGGTFADMTKAIIDEWFSYLESLNATKFRRYVEEWLNLSDGLSGKVVTGSPKDTQFFYMSQGDMTIWNVLQKVAEAPFNELWFDEGPRGVYYEASQSLAGRPGQVTFDLDKTYMVLRQTPFSGTVTNGNEVDIWSSLPAKTIPLGYLTRFDLNKTMEESFSFYLVSPAIYNPGQLDLVATGSYEFDQDAFNKYLYRPLQKELFYDRAGDPDNPNVDPESNAIFQQASDAARTLKNWYALNDKYLSGSFSIMVPSNTDFDPRIGEKIEFEGLEGDYFYVEGVARNWQYGQKLSSQLTVTRGYHTNRPIELKDRIFKRGLFAMNRQFDE